MYLILKQNVFLLTQNGVFIIIGIIISYYTLTIYISRLIIIMNSKLILQLKIYR